MITIQKHTMKSGYKFETEYHACSKAQLQEIERDHLGSIPLEITGMTYEFVEVD